MPVSFDAGAAAVSIDELTGGGVRGPVAGASINAPARLGPPSGGRSDHRAGNTAAEPKQYSEQFSKRFTDASVWEKEKQRALWDKYPLPTDTMTTIFFEEFCRKAAVEMDDLSTSTFKLYGGPHDELTWHENSQRKLLSEEQIPISLKDLIRAEDKDATGYRLVPRLISEAIKVAAENKNTDVVRILALALTPGQKTSVRDMNSVLEYELGAVIAAGQTEEDEVLVSNALANAGLPTSYFIDIIEPWVDGFGAGAISSGRPQPGVLLSQFDKYNYREAQIWMRNVWLVRKFVNYFKTVHGRITPDSRTCPISTVDDNADDSAADDDFEIVSDDGSERKDEPPSPRVEGGNGIGSSRTSMSLARGLSFMSKIVTVPASYVMNRVNGEQSEVCRMDAMPENEHDDIKARVNRAARVVADVKKIASSTLRDAQKINEMLFGSMPTTQVFAEDATREKMLHDITGTIRVNGFEKNII